MTYELVERRVEVGELKLGMYVCRLDRPWQETAFPLQGVLLETDADIAAVRDSCEFVFIDAQREVRDVVPSVLRHAKRDVMRFEHRIDYADAAAVEDEAPRAQVALHDATQRVGEMFDILADGGSLTPEAVDGAVRPVVESVLRNADAFFWIENLRRHDKYAYSHAINCSALAAAFGRHMGFVEDTIMSLAAGALLMDVGKTALPEELLQRPAALDDGDWEQMRSHVARSLAILEDSGILDDDVRDIVRSHHERHDGSGYPDGLIANAIPLTGRMAALVDSFDALTSARPYRAAVGRHQALRMLYAGRDTLYQGEMMEQFQACLGVYPTGTVVELTSGEVAMVIAQNRVRRLRPRVAVLTAADGQLLDAFRTVDLMNQIEGQGQVEIRRALDPDSLAFDATELFL